MQAEWITVIASILSFVFGTICGAAITKAIVGDNRQLRHWIKSSELWERQAELWRKKYFEATTKREY